MTIRVEPYWNVNITFIDKYNPEQLIEYNHIGI